MKMIDYDLALEILDGEKELLDELLQAYIDEENLDEKKLCDLESKDLLEAAKYVHFYKGGARQLAAKDLAQKGQNLEDVLRGKSQGNLHELNIEFIDSYTKTIEEIKSILNS